MPYSDDIRAAPRQISPALPHFVFGERDMLGVAVVRASGGLQERSSRREVRTVVEEFHVRGGVVAKLWRRQESSVDSLWLQLDGAGGGGGIRVRGRGGNSHRNHTKK